MTLNIGLGAHLCQCERTMRVDFPDSKPLDIRSGDPPHTPSNSRLNDSGETNTLSSTKDDFIVPLPSFLVQCSPKREQREGARCPPLLY